MCDAVHFRFSLNESKTTITPHVIHQYLQKDPDEEINCLKMGTHDGGCDVTRVSWIASPSNKAHFNHWRKTICSFGVPGDGDLYFHSYSQYARQHDQDSVIRRRQRLEGLVALNIGFTHQQACQYSPFYFATCESMIRSMEKAEREYTDCPLVGLPFASVRRHNGIINVPLMLEKMIMTFPSRRHNHYAHNRWSYHNDPSFEVFRDFRWHSHFNAPSGA